MQSPHPLFKSRVGTATNADPADGAVANLPITAGARCSAIAAASQESLVALGSYSAFESACTGRPHQSARRLTRSEKPRKAFQPAAAAFRAKLHRTIYAELVAGKAG